MLNSRTHLKLMPTAQPIAQGLQVLQAGQNFSSSIPIILRSEGSLPSSCYSPQLGSEEQAQENGIQATRGVEEFVSQVIRYGGGDDDF